jgi:hypothetical protein
MKSKTSRKGVGRTKPAPLTYGQIDALARGIATDLTEHEETAMPLMLLMDDISNHGNNNAETIANLLNGYLFIVVLWTPDIEPGDLVCLRPYEDEKDDAYSLGILELPEGDGLHLTYPNTDETPSMSIHRWLDSSGVRLKSDGKAKKCRSR